MPTRSRRPPAGHDATVTVGATCRMHGLELFAYMAGVCTTSMAGLAVPQLPQLPPDPRLHRTWHDQSPVARPQLTPVNGYARPSDRSPRRPVRVAPWPAGGRRDRVGHRVPGHWAGMVGAWAYPAGRTTEAEMSCLNAAPPGFRDPGPVPPTGRSPRGGQRSPPAAQQPVPAGWRSRIAALTRTRKECHPAPYPRERLRVREGMPPHDRDGTVRGLPAVGKDVRGWAILVHWQGRRCAMLPRSSDRLDLQKASRGWPDEAWSEETRWLSVEGRTGRRLLL